MKCTKCGSENTQRLELAYKSNTHTIKSHSAPMFSFSNLLGIGGITTKSQGSTLMAQTIEPPVRKGEIIPFFFVLFSCMYALNALVFILSHAFSFQSILAFIFMVLFPYLTFRYFFKVRNYNKKLLPQAMKQWQESWLCQKCGNIYHDPI